MRFAGIEAEYLLVNICVHVERLDRNIGAMQRPLEASPEVLNALSVDLAVDVLFHVVDGLVSEVLELVQTVIADVLIGVDVRVESHVLEDLILESASLHVRDDLSPNLTGLAIQHPHDDSFLVGFNRTSFGVLVLSFAADECLIHFHSPASAAKG